MLSLPDKEVSFWRRSAGKTTFPSLQHDVKVDTAVVGGGIAGLSAAYLLKEAGQTVAVVEKDRIGCGTTGFTTGKVTSQHNLIYDELNSRLGRKAARVYGQANQSALEQIAGVIKKHEIDCGFTRADNYVFTADPKQISRFKKEAKTAAALGLPASFVTTAPLPFKINGAVKFTNQAYMNAQQYVNGLAAVINRNGSRVFESSRAISIHGASKPRIRTKEAAVWADNIIVATNVPTFPLAARGAYCIVEYPRMSYVIACQAGKQPKGMYISPDSDHYSILPVSHKGQKLVLVAGGNPIRGWGFGSRRHHEKLAAYAEQKLGATAVKYRWSAHDYIAYDDLPLVGKLYPWSENIYVVSAFRKWGLSNSMASAVLLRDLITGRPNAAETIFNPHRLSAVASIPHTIAKSIGS